MNHKLNPICDCCKELQDTFKKLRKVKKEYLCKKCYQEKRQKRRQNLMEDNQELKEDLRVLKNKASVEYRERRNGFRRKVGRPKKVLIEDIPKIKNSKENKKRLKLNSYITLKEKQDWFRILVRRGIDPEDAKERVRELVSYQSEVRKKIYAKNKSEIETEKNIKQKQAEMLEELWNS